MRKIMILILVILLLVGTVSVTSCQSKVTVSESRNDGFFSTEKSTTRCGIGGCSTESKRCPMWDRDC